MQIDRLLSASKTSPAETSANNSGWYILMKSHIPLLYQPKQLNMDIRNTDFK